MALFNQESQRAAFKAKIIGPLLFLWGLQAIKKPHKKLQNVPVHEETVLGQTGLFTKYLKLISGG